MAEPDLAGTDWAEQAAAEGAAVSADPGESGDPGTAPPDSEERTFDSPDSDPSPAESPATDEVAPGNHMGPGGDPAEG